MAFFEPPPELGFKLEYPEDIRPLPKTLNELEATGAIPYFDKLFDKLYFDTGGACGWMPAMQAAVNAFLSGTDHLRHRLPYGDPHRQGQEMVYRQHQGDGHPCRE